jgi:hypothetical protein
MSKNIIFVLMYHRHKLLEHPSFQLTNYSSLIALLITSWHGLRRKHRSLLLFPTAVMQTHLFATPSLGSGCFIFDYLEVVA